MNLFKKIWLILCLSIIFCSSSSFSKEEQEDILYIDAGIFNLDSTIPPPPISSSFEYKLEIDFIFMSLKFTGFLCTRSIFKLPTFVL